MTIRENILATLTIINAGTVYDIDASMNYPDNTTVKSIRDACNALVRKGVLSVSEQKNKYADRQYEISLTRPSQEWKTAKELGGGMLTDICGTKKEHVEVEVVRSPAGHDVVYVHVDGKTVFRLCRPLTCTVKDRRPKRRS